MKEFINENWPIVCIYHSVDFDGICSAAIVRRKFKDYNVEFHGWNYGQKIPMYLNYNIIMVDISFPMYEMVLLNQKNNLIWIDHHISAILDYDAYYNTEKLLIDGKRLDGTAACELTWNYFYPNEVMPLSVLLLGMYDTWRNKDKTYWDNYVIPFQYGMKNRGIRLETFEDDLLNQDSVLIDKIIENGKTIWTYQEQYNRKIATGSFVIEWDGFKVLCLNKFYGNSNVLDTVYNEGKHDLMAFFNFNGKMWNFTLFTTKEDVDCSLIAKKFGGGGHKKAAGFRVESIESILKNIKYE